MNKFILSFLIFILLIIISKESEKNDSLEEEKDISGDDFYGYFKQSLKDYLIKNKLYKSNREIESIEMKKIFFDIVTEGGPESSPKELRKAFDMLANHYIDKYYNENKHIRGKDIYNLLDIDDIYNTFGGIVAENPLFGGSEEEEQVINVDNNIDKDL